ncbi:MAG: tRNA 2-thiouridine(34) synthase MnmA [Candidatus Nealsonbacteria bacterium RBG_13_36_15]|uniref:tRNA-specific 2-thiouridylase MnmA n=1 Tax=Candidatus Nealsonbacteria bacterium RBG_13_36_15 TaxID=1801660 RepID=A0A1G2DWV6_9BACT|nr:MAG: tRNA 2-thiouridine(34) synthase MnmA [Candidatus Nealsonbacteria bacterium RBG_13_36_15]
MDNIQKKKIIIAMSGGIDSSVAAVILKKAGFEVTGVFMKFWREPGIQKWNKCCSPESEKRARRVAMLLGIPFYVLNLEEEFKKIIVDYFLKEHKKGFTPNPCVVCNKEIKFSLLFKKAQKLEADYIATGHYAKIIKSNADSKLLQGKDKEKDQSYFLWQLNQKQLRKILFPLGDFTKKEVRNLAKRYKLPVSDIPESQEICFIQNTVGNFLKRHLKQKSGEIVDTKGKSVGRHQGLAFFTIGQRKGIGLAGGPYFVLGKDLKRNILLVTRKKRDLYKKELVAKNINWISGRRPNLPLRVRTKIRYRSGPDLATIKPFCKRTLRVIFDKSQKAITQGQSVVFYRKKELLGGGIIG